MELREIMTERPVVIPITATVHEAACIMRDHDIGDVLVEHDGHLVGIVTDRDLVLRVVAYGSDPTTVLIGDVCTNNLTTLPPDCPAEDAVEAMRRNGLRRIPVVHRGQAVGIVTLGDLARELDRQSALAAISAAPPNA